MTSADLASEAWLSRNDPLLVARTVTVRSVKPYTQAVGHEPSIGRATVY